jgi:hypothetical protein
MRNIISSIPQLSAQAFEHLKRNVSVLHSQIAALLLSSSAVRNAEPQLIALDAAEIARITDFQWSPYYSGTDIHTAVASDPIKGPQDHDVLARLIRTSCSPGADVVFACFVASKTDTWMRNVSQEWRSCNGNIFVIHRFDPDEPRWLEGFEETLRRASTPGFDVGFCTHAPAGSGGEWTVEEFGAMVAASNCIFAAALDGEGYLVWKSKT